MRITRSVRGAAVTIALLAAMAPGWSSAQEVVLGPTPNADRLADNMRTLARDPDNVNALISAGLLNVKLADPGAALQFFERAEKQAPNDPRIPAGRGSALVAMERPGEALRLFKKAEAEGLAPATYAADRGLAYDLLGRPLLAQGDYRLAIAKNGDNEELTRRLALSLGISGDTQGAADLLETLLRKQDKAAWRAQAFILAMNGDTAGANKIASTMFPNFGPDFAPYFRELARLSPAERAHAVHFGRLRLGPDQLADARLAPALPADPAEARVAAAEPVARAKKQKRSSSRKSRAKLAPPIAQTAASTPPPSAPVASSPAPAPAPTPTPAPARTAPVRTAAAPPPARKAEPASTVTRTPPARASQPVAVRSEPVQPASPPPAVTASGRMVDVRPATGAARRAPAHRPSERLASIMSGVGIPASELDVEPIRPVAERPAEAATPIAEKPAAPAKPKPKAKAKPPVETDPARHWVQVAGGANEDALARTYKKLVADAPDLFKGKEPWTAKLRATNRILVGPFDSADAAQDFVNALAKNDLSGFAWNSEKGEAVRKLPLK